MLMYGCGKTIKRQLYYLHFFQKKMLIMVIINFNGRRDLPFTRQQLFSELLDLQGIANFSCC